MLRLLVRTHTDDMRALTSTAATRASQEHGFGWTFLASVNSTDCNALASHLDKILPGSNDGVSSGQAFKCWWNSAMNAWYLVNVNRNGCDVVALTQAIPAPWSGNTWQNCGNIQPNSECDALGFTDSNGYAECTAVIDKFNNFSSTGAPTPPPPNGNGCTFCTVGGQCEPSGGFCCHGYHSTLDCGPTFHRCNG